MSVTLRLLSVLLLTPPIALLATSVANVTGNMHGPTVQHIFVVLYDCAEDRHAVITLGGMVGQV